MDKEDNNNKIVKIKHKIDSDFILNLYDRAKAEKGKKRKELMDQVYFFSKHIGEYLAQTN